MLFKWTVALSPAAKALISCDHNLETTSFDVGQTLRESLFLIHEEENKQRRMLNGSEGEVKLSLQEYICRLSRQSECLTYSGQRNLVWRINQPGGIWPD